MDVLGKKIVVWLLGVVSVLAGCNTHTKLQWHEEQGYRWAEISPGYFGSTGFKQMEPSETGVRFKNYASKNDIKENRNFLNGAGVAAGDVDGDGLTDLYFAQLDGSNKLYKNVGHFAFKDITQEAGVAHEGYNSTGVTFSDIEGDGDLDLLVSSMQQDNVLYLNDGEGHFKLEKDSGLGVSNGSTTMALADIDGDGDLDLYIANYKVKTVRDIYSQNELKLNKTIRKGKNGKYEVVPPFDKYYGIIQMDNRMYRNEYGTRDELYLNEGDGTFSKVEDLENRFMASDGSPQGLYRDWGLTARFQDINQDGHPDLYVCNDFWTPDRIWVNQGNGTFKEMNSRSIRNLSFSSMGVDFSDINRDGSTDFFVTEMLSESHQVRMRQLSDYLEAIDGRPQYNRNSLYFNRQDHTFSEISYYSGIEATGWSWATNFLDVDLDGYEDLIIATGNAYDYQDLDTQLKMDNRARQNKKIDAELLEYPSLESANKGYRNNRNLTFTDESAAWGFDEKDVSQGMALADLDNDGDLDIVMTRLNENALVYKNTGTAPRIAVRLKGRKPNTQGIGAMVELQGGPVIQSKEMIAGGGYLSGSEPMVTFASDRKTEHHKLVITWPDGVQSSINGVEADRIYEITEPRNTPPEKPVVKRKITSKSIFEDISGRLNHIHVENSYNDFKVRPLLPYKLSKMGPGVAWIDYDRDGDDDLFVGSGKGGRLAAFQNDGAGQFHPVDLGEMSRTAAGDQTAIIGWASGDDTDIMIGSANYEQGNAHVPSAYQFQYDGDQKTKQFKLSGILSATGPLAAADYDGDGDIDLFVGGRFKPGRYPENATSRLFMNEDGLFHPDEINSRKLKEIGLVTGAVFSDYDGDGDPDLILSREWDSILVLRNTGGNFQNVSDELGLKKYKGWWNGVATGDFNNDGRPDIVATNIGLNSPYQMDSKHPLKMYYEDFNQDGRLDIVEARYDKEIENYVPIRHLYELGSVSTILRNVKNHKQYAGLSVEEIFGRDFSKVPYKAINTLQHMIFLNNGKNFTAEPLPVEAQFSVAFDAGVADFDNDGSEDIFLSQNSFTFPDNKPRLDAGRGAWLKGDGKGEFRPVPGTVSGVKIYGEQRGAALSDFNNDGKVDLAVSENGSVTKLYENRGSKSGIRIKLKGSVQNRDAIGSSLRLIYGDGKKGPRREIQAGSGYWSQNSTNQVLGRKEKPVKLEISWFDGTTQEVDVVEGQAKYMIEY